MDDQTGCGMITGFAIIIGVIVGGCMLHNSLKEEAKRTPRFVASVSLNNHRAGHSEIKYSSGKTVKGSASGKRCVDNPWAQGAHNAYDVPLSLIQCVHYDESRCRKQGMGKYKAWDAVTNLRISTSRSRQALKAIAANLGVSTQSLGSNRVGAMGPFQFLPTGWIASGVDADDDGVKNPYSEADSTYACAKHLRRAKNKTGSWRGALYKRNPSKSYVARVASCAGL